MKPYYVKDLKPDEGHIIEDSYLVRQADIRDGNKGKKHLYLTLADATGDVQAVKWSLTKEEISSFSNIKTGMIIAIAGRCKEWQGKNQIVIDVIKGRIREETVKRDDFYKSAPHNSQDMYDFIIDTIDNFEDEDLRKICRYFYDEYKERLMYYPAAMSNHHAEYGGLLYHVMRMLEMGIRACEVYTFLNKDLLLAGIVLHDVQKMEELNSDENGVVSEYTLKGKMIGHLVMGVTAIEEAGKALGIDEEKSLMLQHMSLSHHYEPEFGSPRKPLFPEAEILHYIDILDAKMYDSEEALRYVKPGEFSEKVFTLDNRRLYKKTF
ncbi:MAG TPA: HD domain-containing protein [Mogibacterium sp.]|nr:HD domain-containing protein [Mogibacterium sp.]